MMSTLIITGGLYPGMAGTKQFCCHRFVSVVPGSLRVGAVPRSGRHLPSSPARVQDGSVDQQPDSDVDEDARRARGLWTLLEPLHAVTYFTPEGTGALAALGLRGFWRGYFAGRCGPLGAVNPGPVTALFHGFSPATEHRALPAVWDLVSPADAVAARCAGAGAALRRLAADAGLPERDFDDQVVADLADRLWAVAGAADCAGRAMAGANADLPAPGDPWQRLWQAATTLREHRGDGHVAALVAAGLSGPQVLALRCGADLDRRVLQPARGWSDPQWQAAVAELTADGLLDDAARVTEAGRELLAEVERSTDTLAADPWAVEDDVADLAVRLRPLTLACATGLPEQDLIGTAPPWDAGQDPEALTVGPADAGPAADGG